MGEDYCRSGADGGRRVGELHGLVLVELWQPKHEPAKVRQGL